MRLLTIGENEAGQRLDRFLEKYMDQAPKSFFYKMPPILESLERRRPQSFFPGS